MQVCENLGKFGRHTRKAGGSPGVSFAVPFRDWLEQAKMQGSRAVVTVVGLTAEKLEPEGR